MNAILWGILGYVLLQIVIGFVVSRRIRDEEDYVVAGRTFGYPLAIFSIFATWFGAEACIGAAGAVHEGGLAGGSADPFGYALCLFFMAALFAAPLWRKKLLTLADLFRERFGAGVERFAAILMIPTSVLWAAAQIRAFGQVLAHEADALPVSAAITLATGVVLTYTVVGGMLADAWTDVVQGVLLMIGLIVLGACVFVEVGGAEGVAAAVPAERLRLTAPGATWLEVANDWTIPIVGSVMAQELVARVSASRSARVARNATYAAAGIYLLFGAIPAFVGLVGGGMVGDLADPERVLPAVAEQHLSTVPYVLFVGVLVSAILSTVDSALLVAGTLLSHNLVVPLLPRIGERGKLRAARAGVFLFGVCAWGLALLSDSVHDLVAEASGFGSAGIFVLAAAALFLPARFGGRASAFAALAAGVLVWVLLHFLWPVPGDYVWTLLATAAAYVVFGGRR